MKTWIVYSTFIVFVSCTDNTAEIRAKNAIDEASYSKELVDCKEKGKVAHDIGLYNTCAALVDKKYGVGDKAGPDQ